MADKTEKTELIKSITIENFRQFEHLEINGMKRVNVFVGANNCGKSSVMEAVAIFLGHIPSILKTTQNRKMNFTEPAIKTFFHNQQTDKKISLTSNGKNIYFKITRAITTTNEVSQQIYHLQFTHNDKTVALPIALNQPIPATKMKPIAFINANTAGTQTVAPLLQQLFKKGRKRQLLELCSFFNLDIQDYGIENNIDIYMELPSVKEPILLNALGDGFIKYLTVITSFLDHSADYLFIDEIENGLHFTTIKELLKVMLKLAKEEDIQLFFTTHNQEVLKYLAEVMNEEDCPLGKDEVAIIHLAQTLKGVKSYSYTVDGLSNMLETESEIRD